MSHPKTLLLIGAESSICCEFLETMERAGISVTASIVTGPAEWGMAVAILAENGQPVEYDQPLFVIR